jgi:hypothetical protein
MHNFKTIKPLNFFPAIGFKADCLPSYWFCEGEEFQLPAGTIVHGTLDPVTPGRYLVKAEGPRPAFRFVGLDEAERIETEERLAWVT